MFARGMSYRDIRGHVEDMYGIHVSDATLSGVTDSLIPKLQAWQQCLAAYSPRLRYSYVLSIKFEIR